MGVVILSHTHFCLPLQLTTVKAQCVYLRAFYQLCHHEIVNALDDFFDTLQRLEVSLVPDYK